jgi:hypothetical protein
MESRPAIGFYYDRDEVKNDISIMDGVEFVLAVSDADLVHFQSKIFDYGNGRFWIRSPEQT